MAGDLCRRLDALGRKTKAATALEYPACVTSSARPGKICTQGVNVDFSARECAFISRLEGHPTGIFGGGVLLSSAATRRKLEAERAKGARVIELSPREQAAQAWLDAQAAPG